MDIKDVIKKDWETSKMTFNELSDKHGVPASTIKSWKARDKKRGEEWLRATTASDKKKMQKKKIQKEVAKLSDELNEKQKLFCIYYIKYFNATKAYQKAYGCSYESAMVSGHHHLRNPKITAEIERLKAEKLGNHLIEANDIVQKYIDIAFADMNDFMDIEVVEKPLLDDYGEVVLDETGQPVIVKYNRILVKENDEIDGTIVNSITQGKDGVSVKLADRMKALEMLTKYKDVLDDKTKKKLEVEKLKLDNMKTKAELERLENGDSEEPLKIEIVRRESK